MNYVAVAYGLTFIVIGGYGASVVQRRREVERSIGAWSERSVPQGADAPAVTDIAATEDNVDTTR